MIQGWFKRAPKAHQFLQQCAQAPVKGKTLITPFGRHKRFGLVTQATLNELQNEAKNFIIQSTSSDLTLLSAIEAEPELRKIGSLIVNMIHDSILMEVDASYGKIKQSIEIVSNIMQEMPKKKLNSEVPFATEFEIGKRWGSMEELENIEEVKKYVT